MHKFTALFFATTAEIRFIKKRLKISSRILGEDFTVYVADSHPKQSFLLIQTGIGPTLAQNAGDYVFKNFSVHEAWLFGLCGALEPHLKVGEAFLANTLINEKKTQLFTSISLNQQVKDFFSQNQIPLQEGTLLTSSSVIESANEKKEIQKKYACAGVEMEAFPLAKLAETYQVPFTQLRWVMDSLDFSMPATSEFVDAQGDPIFSKLFLSLLKKPSQIGSLVKLSGHVKAALQAQNRFLEKFFDLKTECYKDGGI